MAKTFQHPKLRFIGKDESAKPNDKCTVICQKCPSHSGELPSCLSCDSFYGDYRRMVNNYTKKPDINQFIVMHVANYLISVTLRHLNYNFNSSRMILLDLQHLYWSLQSLFRSSFRNFCHVINSSLMGFHQWKLVGLLQ